MGSIKDCEDDVLAREGQDSDEDEDDILSVDMNEPEGQLTTLFASIEDVKRRRPKEL